MILKWGLFILMGFGPFFSLAGCGPQEEAPDERLLQAESLAKAIEGHESWSQHPEFNEFQTSSDGTHGKTVQVWMNDVAAGVMGSFDGTFPDGTIFVKRGYDGDEPGTDKRGFVTVMQKVDAIDPDNGDWFTLRVWDEDSATPGKLSSYADANRASDCLACHSPASTDHDYIRFLLDQGITF